MNKMVSYALLFLILSCSMAVFNNAMEDPHFDPTRKKLEEERQRYYAWREAGYSLEEARKKEEEYKAGRTNTIPVQKSKSGAKERVREKIVQRRKARNIPVQEVVLTPETISDFESIYGWQEQEALELPGTISIMPYNIFEEEDIIDYSQLTDSAELMPKKDNDTNN